MLSQRKMSERRMAALKQNSHESESEDGESTYRSFAGMNLPFSLQLHSSAEQIQTQQVQGQLKTAFIMVKIKAPPMS